MIQRYQMATQTSPHHGGWQFPVPWWAWGTPNPPGFSDRCIQNLNLNYMMSFVEDETIEGRLSGPMLAGEAIHLVSRGEDVLNDSTVSWDLDVRTTVYTPLPKD